MGKSSKKPQAPEFQESETKYGNQTIGRTYRDNGRIVQQYYASPEEIQRQQIANQKINEILPTLGQTGSELSAQYNQMQQAYTDNALQQFNNMYDPALRNMREDVASRFGTLAATPFLDQYKEMEKNIRQPALTQIVNQGIQLKQDLYNQNESRKLQELQALGYNLNADQQLFLNSLNSSLAGSNSANQFNLTNYKTQLDQYNKDRSYNSGIFGNIGQLAGMAAGSYIPGGSAALGQVGRALSSNIGASL